MNDKPRYSRISDILDLMLSRLNEITLNEIQEAYYRALRQTQTTLSSESNYEPWLMFFLKTLQKQKIRLEYKLKQTEVKQILTLNLPEVSARIMDVFETKERATISELSELTGTNINTIKKHLANLGENNYLIKHEKTRGAWYTKEKEAFDLAKGIITGMDLSTEIGYRNACNNKQNSYMEPWQKEMMLCEVHKEYVYRKNCHPHSQEITDFQKSLHHLYFERLSPIRSYLEQLLQ